MPLGLYVESLSMCSGSNCPTMHVGEVLEMMRV